MDMVEGRGVGIKSLGETRSHTEKVRPAHARGRRDPRRWCGRIVKVTKSCEWTPLTIRRCLFSKCAPELGVRIGSSAVKEFETWARSWQYGIRLVSAQQQEERTVRQDSPGKGGKSLSACVRKRECAEIPQITLRLALAEGRFKS